MGAPQVYEKERVSLNLARLKKGGENFEVILEDSDKALAIRHGEQADIREAINGELVFKNAKKGEKASEQAMQKWLGTSNHLDAAKIILQKGEVHLTAEQRAKIFEERRRKILEYLHSNAADPKTGLPHPIARIELAMKEAKVQIDPTDRIEWQIKKIIPQLQPILPLSFNKVNLRIIIPAKYAGSAYSAVRSKHTMQNENWRNDGSVQFELEIIAGAKSDVFSLVNKVTNGEAQIEELKK